MGEFVLPKLTLATNYKSVTPVKILHAQVHVHACMHVCMHVSLSTIVLNSRDR